MKQHIDTAPVWESYRQDCECPLCLLQAKVEASNVDYFLGESVMEPSQRIEVNKKGFCPGHFKMMYDAGNRLGLALMTHTYMKETVKGLKANKTYYVRIRAYKTVKGAKYYSKWSSAKKIRTKRG